MILIADSGSTKTEWTAMDDLTGEVVGHAYTKGLNPYFVTQDEIRDEIRTQLLPMLPVDGFTRIYFYGSGARDEKQPMIRQAIGSLLVGEVTVMTDMLGAARALCGHEPGIVCILGTGANSCRYDGETIVANVPPLGYILGDEGSGAVLGKHFIADLLKGLLPESVVREFGETYPEITTATILERVYKESQPSRFLASLAPFIRKQINVPEVRSMALECFRSFFRRNVMLYDGWEITPVHFVGSIAHNFHAVLKEAAEAEGIHLGQILSAPMEGLVRYHTIKR
ncbi:ATPase [uncultured Porphyromonas sp.]|uniref:ATPase n=1 Tax=uncultured Porphyromonas sp. TaxID=159274 RepID=UPI0025CED28A|nr:ATPase [uncultured Porphyromonas sp.]